MAACRTSQPPAVAGATVVDEIGRTVAIKPLPARIVSLAPSITEILFALGLDDRIVGVTSYCNYPLEAAKKDKIGDTTHPSLEKIVALKPDLVIASTASQLEQLVQRLDAIGIPVYVSDPRDLDGVLATIGRIGDVCGVGDRAQQLGSQLRGRIEAVEDHVKGLERPKVLVILGGQPLITIGGASFVNDLVVRAGGQSISASENSDYPQYSLESAVAARPEVIFFQAGSEEFPRRLRETPAARAGRIFHIDDDLLLRPGPRVVDGLEQMAAKIHEAPSPAGCRLGPTNGDSNSGSQISRFRSQSSNSDDLLRFAYRPARPPDRRPIHERS